MGKEITRRNFLGDLAAASFLAIPGNKTKIDFLDFSLNKLNSYLNSDKNDKPQPKERKEFEIFSEDCQIIYMHDVSSRQEISNVINACRNKGRESIKFSDFYNFLITGEKTWSSPPFILTFDDGFMSHKENVVPVLEELNAPAVFCVMPGFNNGVFDYMGPVEFREIDKKVENGDITIEWASHTIDHPNLANLRWTDEGAWRAQIVESKLRLEFILGKPIKYFAYPYGAYDTATVELVSENYDAALSINRGHIQRSDEIYLLRRGYPYQ